MSSLNSIYSNGEYLKNHPTWHAEDAEFKAKYIHELIKRNSIEGDSICEIGCGTGQILHELHKKMPNKKYFGFELSSDALKLSKSTQNISFYNEDLLKTDQNFDIMVMADVFEHVDDYLGFISESSKKAKYIVFHIPLDLNVIDLIRDHRLSYKRNKTGHLHFFSTETALDTLKQAGLKIIDHMYTPWCLELQTGPKYFLRNIILAILNKINKKFIPKYIGGMSLAVIAEKINGTHP